MLAYTRDGAVVASLIPESQAAPVSGYGSLGVANLSPDSGTLDFYVLPQGTSDLTNVVPALQSVAYRANLAWATLVAGTFDLVATATGNPGDVRLRMPAVSVANGQVQILAFTSTPGGALVDAVLVDQGHSVRFVGASNARVRLVSALPVAGTTPVAASVVSLRGASPHFGVAASPSATLELVESGVAPVYQAVPLSPMGSVFSVFVIDGTLTPYIVRDR